jgi:hypothetical protein
MPRRISDLVGKKFGNLRVVGLLEVTDAGAPTAQRLSIDRIDPAGDYSPANCQWLTRSENSKRVGQ